MDQLTKPFLYNIPVQKHFCIRIAITAFLQTDAFSIMFIMGIIITRQSAGTTTNAIFIFQKSNCFFLVMSFHEILINAESSMLIAASPAKCIVNFILCDKIFLCYLHRIRQWKFQSLPVKVCYLR